MPKKSSLRIQYLAASDLKPNAKNPRKHSKKQVQQLVASIREFGMNVPILVNQDDQVIAGHGRILACEELGILEIPVIRLEHLTEAQARAFMIADNKLTENAEWDKELLAEHFHILADLELDFSLDITGFEIGEIDIIIEGSAADPKYEEKAIEESLEPPITKPGDLWLLDKHRIFCGDSRRDASYQILMNGKRARMVFTDPPYNVPVAGHVSGLGETKHREFIMASGEMSSEQFINFLASSFQLLAQYSIEGAMHYICMDWRHMQEILAAGHQHYTELKNLCVWVKDNGGMGSLYRSRHELVFVFKQGKSQHINNVSLGKHGRYRTNVWEYAGANSFARKTEEGELLSLHPTVKPVEMIADAILDCSKRQDIILDSFLGSGSTLIAAEKVGRKCYGIEIDPLYVDTVIRRWQKLTGKDAIHAISTQKFNEIINEKGHEQK